MPDAAETTDAKLRTLLEHLASGARQTAQADAARVRFSDADATLTASSGPEGDYPFSARFPLAYDGREVGDLAVYRSAGDFDDADRARLVPLAEMGAAAIISQRDQAALEQAAADKARFIHIATHELRSPVAVAQSLVRGVLKGYAGPLSDKQQEIFRRISRRLDLLENLVNDLLDLAAGQASGAEEVEPVLLNASVGRAVLLLQPRADEKGVTLTLRPWREQLAVMGTDDGLDRIFVNLIGNAVKYTPSGGRVTVVVQPEGDSVRVTVSDTGIGIPADALPHLFEEFYRAPNAKASEEVGTGLGLAIVKDLVQRYNGQITVASVEGEGSTFTVTFPLVRLR